MSDQIGRVLGERYRLVAPVGAGASAMVFLAEDVELRRQVAVKVLHEALAADRRFLEQFRSEAQTTAALNHRNLLAIHDWGFDEVPFIVTEYLPGGTLRDLLDNGELLTRSQALLIGLEAARALEYAHRRGLVHRDIKPSNLLFDEEGRLRIGDFGLSRALAESSVTEPEGVVVGTARYAAPEQAQTSSIDGRADIYSLGLVLIEAVSGSVPLIGETAVATMMSRLAEPAIAPAELGPLQDPLNRCCRVDPAERPDAGELAVALMGAAESLPRPGALPLAGSAAVQVPAIVSPTDLGVSDPPPAPSPIDVEPIAPARSHASDDPFGEVAGASTHSESRAPSLAPSMPAVSAPVTPMPSQERLPDTPVFAPSTAVLTGDQEVEPIELGEDAFAPRPERSVDNETNWLFTALGLLIIVGFAAGAWLLWGRTVTSTAVVPDLAGVDYEDLDALVADGDWDVVRLEDRVDGVDPEEIVGQIPDAGTELAAGEELRVTVSLGDPMAVIPDVSGLTVDDARTRLRVAGLELGTTRLLASEDVGEGRVLRTDIAARQLVQGSDVDLVVSSGPAPRQIPDQLVGLDSELVITEIEALGLRVLVEELFDSEIEEGIVLRVDPEPGTQTVEVNGPPVVVYVSKGPELAIVPDVEELTLLDAQNELKDEGFCIGEIDGPGDLESEVLSTDPSAGAEARLDECVRIITRVTDSDDG